MLILPFYVSPVLYSKVNGNYTKNGVHCKLLFLDNRIFIVFKVITIVYVQLYLCIMIITICSVHNYGINHFLMGQILILNQGCQILILNQVHIIEYYCYI